MVESSFTHGSAPIPEEALKYLKRKKPVTGFSYKDVWAEEHAAAFTVAKGMQLDVVRDIQDHLVEAMKNGTSLKQFKDEMTPLLQKKGWWGKKQMRDPKTGKTKLAQLGSSRRLDLIWQVNMRSAYMAGRWEQSQRSTSHPYLIFKLGPVRTKHRDKHVEWNGTLLPKDDAWWQNHWPPLGYHCNCWARMVGKREYERLKGRAGIRTTPLPDRMKQYVNTRTGATRKVPEGVTPGFEWNQGAYGRSVPLALMLMEKAQKVKGKDGVHTSMREYFSHPVMRDHYQSFVEVGLKKETSEGKMMPLGLLADKYLAYAKKKGKKPASALVAIEERQLTQKQKKHTLSGDELSLEQWFMLPDMLQQPNRVYWDSKAGNDTLLFTKQVEVGILVMPVRFGRKAKDTISIDVMASAFIKPLSYEKMDKQSRYERLE